MQKIRIICFSQDLEYLNYFSSFLNQSEYINKINCSFYTNEQDLKEGTANSKFHLLLTEHKISDELTLNFEDILYLVDEGNTQKNVKRIYKYQPLKYLLSDILSNYYESNGSLVAGKQDKIAGTIAFTGADGGSGKTLNALCMAKAMVNKGNRVFYMSLETLQSTNLYLSSEKDPSTELYYYLKEDINKLLSKIETLKSTDKYSNIDFINQPNLPEEMMNLKPVDIEKLIGVLKETYNYDYIIIDLDSSWHDRNLSVIDIVDDVFWIVDNQEKSFTLTEQLINNNLYDFQWDMKKIHFILNNYEEFMFQTSAKYNISFEKQVPHMHEYSHMSELTKFQSDITIGETLTDLIGNELLIEMEV